MRLSASQPGGRREPGERPEVLPRARKAVIAGSGTGVVPSAGASHLQDEATCRGDLQGGQGEALVEGSTVPAHISSSKGPPRGNPPGPKFLNDLDDLGRQGPIGVEGKGSC